jgi:signal transduction histidine kinase
VIIPDPSAEPARSSEEAIQRAQFLIHELANLLDGSLRQIDLARRLVAGAAAEAADPPPAMRHLDAARAALAHIAAIVRSSYEPSARDRALGVAGSGTPAASLESAIRSAAEVLLPKAKARGIEIRLDLDATTRGVPADEVYAVVSNGLRNAFEAIGERGRIDVRATAESGVVTVEILDDGSGPPADTSAVFELGFSTKPGSSGVGLALAREVVIDLGGRIELRPRNLPSPGRPGAILRATYPVPGPQAEIPTRSAC